MAKIAPPSKSRKGAPPPMVRTVGNLDKPESSSLQTLNLRVPMEFKRDLKVYAPALPKQTRKIMPGTRSTQLPRSGRFLDARGDHTDTPARFQDRQARHRARRVPCRGSQIGGGCAGAALIAACLHRHAIAPYATSDATPCDHDDLNSYFEFVLEGLMDRPAELSQPSARITA